MNSRLVAEGRRQTLHPVGEAPIGKRRESLEAQRPARAVVGQPLEPLAVVLVDQVCGHLGGFLAGLPCGWLMRRPRPLFQSVAPILLSLAAALLYLAGAGRLPTWSSID